MAITLVSQSIASQSIHPVYNNASIVVHSDLANQYMFKYQFETYVNDVLVNTSTSFPREDGSAIFDSSKIIKNYLADNFDPLLTSYSTNFTDEIARCYISASEQINNEIAIRFTDNNLGGPGVVGFIIEQPYSYLFVSGTDIRIQQDAGYTNASYNSITSITQVTDSGSVAIIYTNIPIGESTNAEPGYLYIPAANYTPATVIRDNFNVWQGAAEWEEGKNISTFVSQFIPANTGSVILGSRTNQLSISNLDKRIITFIHNDLNTTQVNKIKLVTDTGRTFIKTLGTIVSSTEMRIGHFPIGLSELNAILWTSGTGTITDDDNGFTISFLTADNVEVLKSVYVKIDNCNKYDNYTVCYKSPRGSFWYVNMNMKNTKSIDVTSTNYQHYVPYNYGNLDRGYSTNNLYAKGRITLRTDWVRSEEAIAEIMDMIKSPLIYLLKNNLVIPVSVNPGSHEIKSRSQNGLVAYEVTFNIDYDNNITL